MTPYFSQHTSFAAQILAHYIALEGSKAQHWVPRMKDYISIKEELEKMAALMEATEGIGMSSAQAAMRPATPKKLPVKRKLHTSPPLPFDDEDKKQKRPRKHRCNPLIAQYVRGLTPPPIHRSGGVNILEGGFISSHRSPE